MNQPIADGFASLELRGWQQFGYLKINFHPRATVITGVNGTGKSTILRLLGSHFEWERVFYGVPNPKSEGNSSDWIKPIRVSSDYDGWQSIGSLDYQGGVVRSELRVRAADSGRGYNIFFFNRENLSGIYIPPQRNQTSYIGVTDVSTTFPGARASLISYLQAVRGREEHSPLQSTSPFQSFKKSLITAALFGGGNEFFRAQRIARASWDGFNALLRHLYPDSLQFTRLFVRESEVIVESGAGEFLFDELSGGLSAMAEIAWQMHLHSLDAGPRFTVLLDEPENHLHPALQRSILPGLMEWFSSAQFIVATHSPFVPASVEDSSIYFLHYTDDGYVTATSPELVNRAANADQVSRDVLQLNSTMPLWAEDRYRQVVQSFIGRTLDRSVALELFNALAESGLDPQFQRAMVDLVDSIDAAGGED